MTDKKIVVAAEKKNASHTMGNPNLPTWTKLLTAALAASTGEFLTVMIDTAKVKLQVQTIVPGVKPQYTGLTQTIWKIFQDEGLFALWKGVGPGIQRQFLSASVKIGCYDMFRNWVTPKDKLNKPPLMCKILAGMLTGSFAMIFAQPADVVKIRLQAQSRGGAAAPGCVTYNGVLDCYKKIAQTEGIAGLWVGLTTNMIRNAIINAAEISTFDASKEYFVGNKLLPDNILAHFVCGSLSGFAATIIGNPVDVVKTRLVNQAKGCGTSYKGPLDVFFKTLTKEGPYAFYKGCFPQFVRLYCWNVITYVSLQYYRKWTSDYYESKGWI
eukprot:TRINITY_DN727_c0_g3_i1.p2 TRINITY_DN727_c0_g3~~TRINITY_DN727_c0_g3_i1.p2  ORF type:complete len:326 (-),score=110.30 TRINITY_DN727_c0_g3_i1:94-1071(-)